MNRHPRNATAPTRERRGGKGKAGKTSTMHDTSVNAQRIRLLTHLRRDSITTIQARRDLNILMPAARVKELRERGCNIVTRLIDLPDDQGRLHHRVAIYSLAGGAI